MRTPASGAVLAHAVLLLMLCSPRYDTRWQPESELWIRGNVAAMGWKNVEVTRYVIVVVGREENGCACACACVYFVVEVPCPLSLVCRVTHTRTHV